MLRRLLPLLGLLYTQQSRSQPPAPVQTDVCIYGGTSAGVIAAYAAKKLHKTVLLIEPGYRLGGLSSGGLGYTDIGNKYVVSGLARDFYRRMGRHYGKFEQWTFEPHVADSLFRDYIQRAAIPVIYGERLHAVHKTAGTITGITLERSADSHISREIKAKVFIDCSYEGDLMAKAAVSYTTGREADSVYNETVDGVQLKDKHQFPDGIDPYLIAGHPESGLLWGISPDALSPDGTGDKKIQSYNFRLCLTNDPANRIPITRPARYDSTHYELLLRYLAAHPVKDLDAIIKIDAMPNHKTDINNNGPFSTDMIGMNYGYPDGDYTTRQKIVAAHKAYTIGLLYFIGHDPRMPAYLRKEMLNWGYPKDEYPASGHWTPQLYIREARRMVGAYTMTQDNCHGKTTVDDGIAKGAYNMDSHNAERIVTHGMVKNEGDVQLGGISPYPIAYRAITPKAGECNNLLVPVCLSASHMAYGSIRMEPVFMVLAQAAAYAACEAIDQQKPVQEIDTRELRTALIENPLADHSIPEILVDNDDSTGITLTGDWQRQTTGGYGPSFLLNTTTAPATAEFTAHIKQTATYNIYSYIPRVEHAATSTIFHLTTGNTSTAKQVNTGNLRVTGQTSGEWVPVDTLHLNADDQLRITISNTGAAGAIVADAVLLVPR
jgi:FAD dependent oxidoreductase